MNEHHQPFEEIRHYGTEGQEFWSARELAPLLDYRDWRNFQKVLARATQALFRVSSLYTCINARQRSL